MRKIMIAIDGYSSCGKSTLANALAKKLDYLYVDTGAMYRAVTLYCLQNNLIKEGKLQIRLLKESMDNIKIEFRNISGKERSATFLNKQNVENEIRKMEVSNEVSKISVIKFVREKMVRLQQQMGSQKGVVMEGRDIGTIVFPDAELKLFMTANIKTRVKRRYREMVANGIGVTLEEVKKNVISRDYKDTHRKESPLIQAKDAIVINNTLLSQDEQLDIAVKLAKERMAIT
ncbi:MAG TPA: (d)CMP kinase [Flavobacteriales bacterium]|nr:(d)CMP kinase [Flavobacteriales bacterium]